MPEDLNSPATKGDIEELKNATKDDIKQAVDELKTATKDDLKKAVDQLGQTDQRLAKAIVDLQADVKEIKHKLATEVATKADISQILTAIDAFAKKGEAYDQKAISHSGILIDHEEKLRDQGRRITRLENPA